MHSIRNSWNKVVMPCAGQN